MPESEEANRITRRQFSVGLAVGITILAAVVLLVGKLWAYFQNFEQPHAVIAAKLADIQPGQSLCISSRNIFRERKLGKTAYLIDITSYGMFDPPSKCSYSVRAQENGSLVLRAPQSMTGSERVREPSGQFWRLVEVEMVEFIDQ